MLKEWVLVLFSITLLVVVDASEPNLCLGSDYTVIGGRGRQTPVHSLSETGVNRNFARCHETLPHQCYFGACIDMGCWEELPRTQGEEGTVYHVEAPYLSVCLYGLGRCVGGVCVEKHDVKEYSAVEESIEYFHIPDVAEASSSFEVCSKHPTCLERWEGLFVNVAYRPTHLGAELPSYDCAPMRLFGHPTPTTVGFEYFAADGTRCEGDAGECFAGRCFASDFPPYCPWPKDNRGRDCDTLFSYIFIADAADEERIPGCSGHPPFDAVHFQ